MHLRLPLAVFALTLLATPAALAAHAPSAEEIVALPQVADVAWAPDGRALVYTVSQSVRDTSARPADDDHDGGWKRTRRIEWVDLATRTRRTLVSGEGRPGSPQVSPDGAWLGFTRTQDGKATVRLLPLAGGESKPLATGELEPGAWRFSPDSRSIAFIAEAPRTEAGNALAWRVGGAHEWNEQYHKARVWVVPIAGGEPRAVTPDSIHVLAAEWSPDGSQIAMTTASSADPYFAASLVSMRTVPASGDGPLRTLPRDPGGYTQFAWAPDGRTIAVIGLDGGLSNWNAIYAWEPASGRVRNLAPDRERTFESIAWAPDSRAVYAVVARRTRSAVERFPLAGGAITDLGRPLDRNVNAGPVPEPHGGSWAFITSTPASPGEVTVFDPAKRKGFLVTDLSGQVADWTLSRTRVVTWTCPEGGTLEGLLTESTSKPASGAPPLVVMPHGGPDAYTGEAFSGQTLWLAAHGYSVFRPNYRGGTAYGFASYAANRNRFGEIEQMDIESGVDALIASGDADPGRLFYGGWSWGGYLTAWTIGHVQRYRAAVVGAGVNDPALSYATGDINRGVAAAWEYEGDPWRQTAHFDRASPIRSAKDIRTPTLILHGESDDRVPFVNGIVLHRALEDMGVETRFIAYPREPHNFVEPAHQLHRLEEWLRWYDTHGGADAARP